MQSNLQSWHLQQLFAQRLLQLPELVLSSLKSGNPDKLLNQDVKTNTGRKKRAATKNRLKKNLIGYLRGRQIRPDLVRRYFEAKHVRYAA